MSYQHGGHSTLFTYQTEQQYKVLPPEVKYGDKFWKLPSKPKEYTYWELLQLPFFQLVDYLSIKFLQKRNKLEYLHDQVTIHRLSVPTVTYTKEYRIEIDDIVKATFQHLNFIYEQTGKRPTKLYLGRDHYHNLNAAISVQIPDYYIANQIGHSDKFLEYKLQRMYAGLQVIYLPWFKGMLAVTD